MLQGKTGKTEFKNKQNHATKVTKIPKNEVMKMKRIQHQTTGNSNLILI